MPPKMGLSLKCFCPVQSIVHSMFTTYYRCYCYLIIPQLEGRIAWVVVNELSTMREGIFICCKNKCKCQNLIIIFKVLVNFVRLALAKQAS